MALASAVLCRLSSVAAAGLFLVAGGAKADDSVPPSPADAQVLVRYFEIPVLVRDAAGAPVEGLAAADLQLRIDGREQPLADLWPVGRRARTTPPPDARLTIDGSDENEPAATVPGDAAHYVVFVDMANDPPTDRDGLVDAVSRAFEPSVRPKDLVAVASYNGSLVLELPFTADRRLLRRALERAVARARPADALGANRLSALIGRLRACEYVPDNPFVASEDEAQEMTLSGNIAADRGCAGGVLATYRQERAARARGYVAALDRIVRYAAGIQGRVTVLAFSHGIATDPGPESADAAREVFGAEQAAALDRGGVHDDSAAPALGELRERAVNERVRFDFIDTSSAPGPGAGARQTSMTGADRADPAAAAHQAARATLQYVADATSGVVVAERAVDRALDAALRAERGRYIASFNAGPGIGADARPAIALAARRPGLVVAAGRTVDAAAEQQRWVAGAVAFGEARARGSDRPGQFVPFVVGVRQTDMDYEASGGRMVADLTLHVRLQTIDGQSVVEQFQSLRHSVPKTEWERGGDAVLSVRGSLELPEGHYLLSAVFSNPRTGRKGVLFREVRVPFS